MDKEAGLEEPLLSWYKLEGTSSFPQAVFNSLGVLLGISFLSTPYALEKAGWLGLGILLIVGIICCYTADLLAQCLANNPNVRSYQNIAEAAFGRRARRIFSVFFYVEIMAVLVGYTISLSDSLTRLFPSAEFPLVTVAILAIIPTVWLRDLRWHSYLSLAGNITLMVIGLTVAYTGVFKNIGFHFTVPTLRAENLLSVSGVYLYCFSGHSIFPSIYMSMKNPSDFTKVSIISFTISGLIYTAFAFVGATMFGDDILPQITLNVPRCLVAGKIALLMVVLIPLSKYSICLNPVAIGIEEKFPWVHRSGTFRAASILLRTFVLILILLMAMWFPYFGTMLSLIGSVFTTMMSMILPCVFYLKIFGDRIPKWKIALNVAVVIFGIALGILGTVASIKDLYS